MAIIHLDDKQNVIIQQKSFTLFADKYQIFREQNEITKCHYNVLGIIIITLSWSISGLHQSPYNENKTLINKRNIYI